jgi:hypothetical protein
MAWHDLTPDRHRAFDVTRLTTLSFLYQALNYDRECYPRAQRDMPKVEVTDIDGRAEFRFLNGLVVVKQLYPRFGPKPIDVLTMFDWTHEKDYARFRLADPLRGHTVPGTGYSLCVKLGARHRPVRQGCGYMGFLIEQLSQRRANQQLVA